MYDVCSVSVFACELGGDPRDLCFTFASFSCDSILSKCPVSGKTSDKRCDANSGDKHCETKICELNFCMWQIHKGRKAQS